MYCIDLHHVQVGIGSCFLEKEKTSNSIMHWNKQHDKFFTVAYVNPNNVGIFSTPDLDTVFVNSTYNMEYSLARKYYKATFLWRQHHGHGDCVSLLRNADALCHYEVTIVVLVETSTPLTSDFYTANIHGSTWNSQQAQSCSYGFCTTKSHSTSSLTLGRALPGRTWALPVLKISVACVWLFYHLEAYYLKCVRELRCLNNRFCFGNLAYTADMFLNSGHFIDM
jgi:hypothetical protein